MSEQIGMLTWDNVSLFSNNYLEHRLPISELWEAEKERAAETFEKVRKYYKTILALNLGAGQEAELENKFIQPVLAALGYVYHVQPVTHRGNKKKRPDYALFRDSESHKAASTDREEPRRFFSQALTILEAKYWGRRLNDADRYDILDSRDPTAQTLKYLEDVHLHTDGKINWAILTNGRHWRLFYYKAASRSGNYFEIDLEEIIKRDNFNDFLYFYLFFSRDAFIPDTITGKTWLDRHVEESESYAKAVSSRLKDLIFDEVFEGLARGFVHYRLSELEIIEETEETRKTIFEGCLTVLYRILFLLYAESRELLPVKERGYFNNSLKKLKEDISKDLLNLGPERMSKRSYTYWARLEGIFNIIAKGDPDLNVPIYNGGLFETPADSFLSGHKLPDPFLAAAIGLLTLDQECKGTPDTAQFIDYSSLNVRHLGDIYEGLLEFHVQVADEAIVEIKEKGKSFWEKLSEVKEGTKTYRRKAKGDVYIENSKHERKATGSYYTPHYIVEYIVKNTVGPVLDERFKKAGEILSDLDGIYKKQRRQLKKPANWKHWEHPGEPKGEHIKDILRLENEVFKTLFDIKLLDPAMGSGHFLVHAVDFISDKTVTFLYDYPDNPVIRKLEEMKEDILQEVDRQGVKIDPDKLTEVNLIKRTVMKRCIYGVDLNEMAVELAKLSLWLDSFTLGAPLSFLDHHLKCGNSLIGTNIDALEKTLTGRLFAINLEPLKRAMRDMIFVSDLPDATVEQVRQSYKKFGEANKGLEGYRILLDMLVAEYFGIPDAKKMLVSDFDKIDINNLHASIAKLPDKDRKLIDDVEAITRQKWFFHWEIEFPEVFYEQMSGYEQKVQLKNNPGFDCVVGNPPYETTRSESMGSETKKYLGLYPVAEDKYDYYWFFINKGNELIRSHGYFSMIIPDTWLMKPLSKNLRRYVLENSNIMSINTLGFSVFKEAVPTCILAMTKPMIEDNKIIFRDSNFNDLSVQSQAAYNKPPYYFINPSLNDDLSRIAEKARKNNYTIENVFFEIYNGVQTGNDKKYLSNDKTSHIQRPIIRGADIDRYSLSWGGTYILWLPNEMHSNQRENIYLHSPKILIRQTADRLISTLERDKNISLATTFVLIKNNKVHEAEEYLLAILNSAFLKYLYQGFNNEVGRVQPQIKRAHIEHLPIPRISFTTPVEERKKAVERLNSLYASGKDDRIVKEVEGLVSEKSDVVHDILAFLAEQMIEMNKAKNGEIKGFLNWLEREVGVEIENLANKTAIKEYHKHDFAGLLDVLKKNKSKLSINLSNRKNNELLEEHFKESSARLSPLKTRLRATDNLIDEIVYRLYGLTDEEVRIVRGEITM